MEITVQQEAEQPVFARTMLTLEITFEDAIPARGAVAAQLAESRSVPVEAVAIRRIDGRFGGGVARCEAFVYESADALSRFEQKHVSERTAKTIVQPEAPVEAAEEPAEAAEETPEEESSEAPAEESSESSEEAEEAAEDAEESDEKKD